MNRNPRKETALRIRLFMQERGLSAADVAEGTGLDSRTVQNLVNGGSTSTTGRKRLAWFLGKSFWPDIVLRTFDGLTDDERGRFERATQQAEQLATRHAGAASPEQRQAILAEFEPLLTPDIRQILAKAGGAPSPLFFRMAAAMAPFLQAAMPAAHEIPPGIIRIQGESSAALSSAAK